MTRILGVSGTLRKGGNTTILLEEALKAVAGRAETDLVALADAANGEQPPKAALADLARRFEAADAVLIATPSHFGAPSAALKALLDETWEAAKAHRLEGKLAAALVVEAETGGELAAQALAHWAHVHRMDFLGYVVGRGLKEREVLFDIKAVRGARGLATRVADRLERR
ncbi:MAG TPA: NAD(P)H-dependent oxidoreductase [Candidatus Thermoplasmatota archaeon]|nr:NAD(P)H-dependent oxidoreductase [Candidatus Thermoplasmatota archaeon]